MAFKSMACVPPEATRGVKTINRVRHGSDSDKATTMATPFSDRPNRGSDTEIVWASPSEPAPVFSGDGRARRARGSSDDNEDEPPSGFINEDLRAGGPYLCPLPVSLFPFPRTHPLAIETDRDPGQLFNAIRSILEAHSITFNSIDFCQCQAEWDPEEPRIPTILISARKSQLDRTWLHASREIHGLLQKKNLNDVSVEIADPRVFEPMQYDPIHPTDTIYPKWDAVCAAILDLGINNCRAIECFRYGRGTDGKNPQTIIVTVSPSESKYKQTREQIVDILNNFELPTVGVIIAKGEIERSATPWMLPWDDMKDAGQAGLSLGKHGISNSSGTFGGWVEIQDATTERWIQLGLTCFHCVDPKEQANTAPPQLLTRWYTNGISANDADAKEYLKVDQPSMHDIENELAVLDEFIKVDQNHKCYASIQTALQADEFITPPDSELYKSIKASLQKHMAKKLHIEQFRDSGAPYLRHVYAGSGYREKPILRENHSDYEAIMDWALIDVEDSRVGDNNITIHGTPIFHAIHHLTTLRNWDVIRPLVSNEDSGTDDLYKVGRSTRFTAGRYNGIKSAHVATKINEHGEQETKVTMEHAIVGISGRFSNPGDSGSFVFTRYGEVIGMIFGGHTQGPISYMTHISDLFDDIKAITGCIGVRIYAKRYVLLPPLLCQRMPLITRIQGAQTFVLPP
ncbi:predicted protein [Uncinocarpus reesii 1704]|uniref:Uncharacterized protein n=1 Tax=Uncinocarpus reesii (strain UAMH 1704) TaxID=336963 RepID=C4JTW9_UNCRE|nr:uncharacterized protein UREG_05908 [Uncinocarpus reesii 1704]EEP81066.1 predicted protein [Uncinocarpus reesii 1704]